MTDRTKPKTAARTKRQRSAGILGILPLLLAIGFTAPAVFYVAMMILLRTGAWCVPLFLSYLTLLLFPTAYFVGRRDLNNQHFILGDELFYTEFPTERKRALRRARKKGIPAGIRDTLARFGREPLPVFEGEDEAFARARRRGRLLFLTAALLLTALAVLLFSEAYHIRLVNSRGGGKQTDYTWIFPLAGGLLVLATAAAAFLRKKSRWFPIVTLPVLLFGAWGAYISVSVNSRLVIFDVLKGFGFAALYALVCFGLLGPAKDLKSREEAYREYAALQYELFELGCLDEDTLRMRLEKRKMAA